MFYILDLLEFQVNYKIKLLLIALVLIVISAFLWLFQGKIPIVIYGKGILFEEGECIIPIISNTSGIVEKFNIAPGDYIKQGSVVAKTYNPKLLNKLSYQNKVLRVLLQQKSAIDSLLEVVIKHQESNFLVTQARLQDNIKLLENNIKNLDEQHKIHLTLLKKKIINRNVVDNIKELLNKANMELNYLKNNLVETKLGYYSKFEDLKSRQQNLTIQIAETENDINIINYEIQEMSKIVANHGGRILEHKVPLSIWVAEGTTISSLLVKNNIKSNQQSDDKYLLAYFPARLGKSIKINMAVQITPSVICKEEYGSILGIVEAVSPFPVSKESVFASLNNQSLVDDFFGNNYQSIVSVRIKLKHNSEDYNGFFWTSNRGPKFKIENGTIADIMVILEYKKPVHLLTYNN